MTKSKSNTKTHTHTRAWTRCSDVRCAKKVSRMLWAAARWNVESARVRARVKNRQEVAFTIVRTTFAFTVAQFQLHFISRCMCICICVCCFVSRCSVVVVVVVTARFCSWWGWSDQIGCFGVFVFFFLHYFRIKLSKFLLGVSLILECRTCDEQLMAVA